MSFVPNPTQANASNNNAKVNTSGPGAAAAAAPNPEESEIDTVFKLRTFDVYWVEKHALMYKDGTTTVSYGQRNHRWLGKCCCHDLSRGTRVCEPLAIDERLGWCIVTLLTINF